jgi:DNA-binding NtrC family response regulator
MLVRGFLRHFSKANEKPLLDLTGDAMNALLNYNWPGNVRELRTAIEHGVVMAHGPKVSLRDLPLNVRQTTGEPLPGGITPARAFGEKSSALDLHETEKRLIMQALATTKGNVTAAAKKLGISRRTLHRKINELNAAKLDEEKTSSP